MFPKYPRSCRLAAWIKSQNTDIKFCDLTRLSIFSAFETMLLKYPVILPYHITKSISNRFQLELSYVIIRVSINTKSYPRWTSGWIIDLRFNKKKVETNRITRSPSSLHNKQIPWLAISGSTPTIFDIPVSRIGWIKFCKLFFVSSKHHNFWIMELNKILKLSNYNEVLRLLTIPNYYYYRMWSCSGSASSTQSETTSSSPWI